LNSGSWWDINSVIIEKYTEEYFSELTFEKFSEMIKEFAKNFLRTNKIAIAEKGLRL
jgi:hypothetical protein